MNVKWSHIIILGLLAALVFSLSDKGKRVETVTVYDHTVDTLKIDSIVYKIDTVIIPQRVDTNDVIKNFFAKRTIDTTVIVREVKLNLSGVVYQNRLTDLNLVTTNLRPTQINRELKWTLAAGLNMGTSVFVPTLYAGYDRHEIGVGYNLIGQNGLVFSYKYDIVQF